ncbi:ABC transporter substrate-binding protein [Halanaerobiaceae bacterium Z-7014]|uniref:ABC transporter substrate-binding protein n=1 Tax=Halonatronomonas betaini TaxID=2778430 RepID=A0A931ATL1_9FIRM|nr:ABC transporter substrate-binding protein [Halonatronomonas betaini]MBF8436205.1 ABC transporter substrate-binding protein [Halonatronomonas betaini]
MKLNLKSILILTLALFITLGIQVHSETVELGPLEAEETLVMTGALWSPPSTWNILIPDSVRGTGGLVYETMFSYHPLNDEFTPWLAKSGEWVEDDVYLVEFREGIAWSDGVDFSAEDVVFTYELAKENDLYYSPVWDMLDSVVAEDDLTVRFTFDEPQYALWDSELYERYIIPEHIWSEVPSDELITRTMREPVGTGPYTYRSSEQDRMVWERDDNWWGIEVFGEPTPKNIVDLVGESNNVTMGMLMRGELDLSHNFLPGIQRIIEQFDLQTWFEEEPYMIPWNTVNLYMNTLTEPMDDVEFRKAMAYMVNPNTIVERVYGGLVEAANPTGLFGGGWGAYLDEEVVEEHGFEYDIEKAKEILDAAGYVDENGDGWRQMPNGDNIELELAVPSGWTDWMESVNVITNYAEEVGINIVSDFPDSSLFHNKRFNRDFDMILAHFETSITSSPFDYWNGVANSDIHGDQITQGNYGSYDNPELFEMIERFNKILDEDERQEIATEIQTILLQDMPTVPLWHNGMWMQATTNNWTNWPNENNPYGIPVSGGVSGFQIGMIQTLIGIEPAQ